MVLRVALETPGPNGSVVATAVPVLWQVRGPSCIPARFDATQCTAPPHLQKRWQPQISCACRRPPTPQSATSMALWRATLIPVSGGNGTAQMRRASRHSRDPCLSLGAALWGDTARSGGGGAAGRHMLRPGHASPLRPCVCGGSQPAPRTHPARHSAATELRPGPRGRGKRRCLPEGADNAHGGVPLQGWVAHAARRARRRTAGVGWLHAVRCWGLFLEGGARAPCCCAMLHVALATMPSTVTPCGHGTHHSLADWLLRACCTPPAPIPRAAAPGAVEHGSVADVAHVHPELDHLSGDVGGET